MLVSLTLCFLAFGVLHSIHTGFADHVSCTSGPSLLVTYGDILEQQCKDGIVTLQNSSVTDLTIRLAALETVCVDSCFGTLYCNLKAEDAECLPNAKRFRTVCTREDDSLCITEIGKAAFAIMGPCANLSTADQCANYTECTAAVEAAIRSVGCCINIDTSALPSETLTDLVTGAIAKLKQVQATCGLGAAARAPSSEACTNPFSEGLCNSAATARGAVASVMGLMMMLLSTIVAAAL